MRRGTAIVALLAGSALHLAAASPSGAQDDERVDANRQWLPGGATDLASVRTTGIEAHGEIHLGITTQYLRNPLLLVQGENERPGVRDRWEVALRFAIGFWDRVQVGVVVPSVFLQAGVGTQPIGASEGALEARIGHDVLRLRDIRFQVDWQLLRRDPAADGFGLLLSLGAAAPTASSAGFVGSGQWTFAPELVADYRRDQFRVAINGGARLRADERVLGEAHFGSSVVGRIGLGYSTWREQLTWILEGGAVLELAGQPDGSAAQHVYDIAAGLRVAPEEAGDYAVYGTLGTGFGGLGAPAVRLMVGVSYRDPGRI